MSKIEVGSYIGIPCSAQDGPFDKELIVEFESLDGTISGFADVENVREEGGQHFIKGQVRSIENKIVQIWVEGSFFSTNGLASFSSERAELMPLAA